MGFSEAQWSVDKLSVCKAIGSIPGEPTVQCTYIESNFGTTHLARGIVGILISLNIPHQKQATKRIEKFVRHSSYSSDIKPSNILDKEVLGWSLNRKWGSKNLKMDGENNKVANLYYK